MLYPVTNTKRTAISLNGLWNFAFVNDDYNPKQKLSSPILMGVPSSYNDLFTTLKERDHIGLVVYEKQITHPSTSSGTWNIRIGAAGHRVKCYINGVEVTTHNGGFLPIDFEVPTKTTFRLTIVLDNRLDYQTLPIATYTNKNDIEKVDTHFDFYNYTGLHRNVYLYHLPEKPIKDVVIKTNGIETTVVSYEVDTLDDNCAVTIKDPYGNAVGINKKKVGSVTITNPILWDIGKGNLYTLCIETSNDYYELLPTGKHMML